MSSRFLAAALVLAPVFVVSLAFVELLPTWLVGSLAAAACGSSALSVLLRPFDR